MPKASISPSDKALYIFILTSLSKGILSNDVIKSWTPNLPSFCFKYISVIFSSGICSKASFKLTELYKASPASAIKYVLSSAGTFLYISDTSTAFSSPTPSASNLVLSSEGTSAYLDVKSNIFLPPSSAPSSFMIVFTSFGNLS